MTKIDIFSGFLGAGKTTLIRKLIQEAYKGEKLVLIENEFGDIAIDGGFLQDAGIEITEMNSGCICCTLVGDFTKALKKVISEYAPDRILIEPSGVGKLSDVAAAVVHLNAMYVLRSAETVFTTCLKANANDPDTTARFVRNLLRSPNCKEEAYSVLGGILIRLATMVRRPEALLSVAEKLKNDGYLEQRQLAAIQHQIQRRQPNP